MTYSGFAFFNWFRNLILAATVPWVFPLVPKLAAIDFEFAMDAEQVIPAPELGGSSPTGTVLVSVDTVTGEVTVAGSYDGLTSVVSAAHIHGFAEAGETAGVILALTVSGGISGTIAGNGTLTSEQVGQLLRGRTYVNVHTENNGPGELRGQIVDPTIRIITMEMSADQEVPPVDLEGAHGNARIVVDTVSGGLEVVGDYSGMSSVVQAAHIHGFADREQNAGVMLELSVTGGVEGRISGRGTLSNEQRAGLFSGLTYVNVHTINNGAGEVRGQIIDDQMRRFRIPITADQAVPGPAVEGAAPEGSAIVAVDLPTSIASVRGRFSGMTSDVSAAHIHGFADRGETAGVLIPLTVSGGTEGTLSAVGAISADTLAGILSGRTYINIHTTNNGSGEIRGQIDDGNLRRFEIDLTTDEEVPPPSLGGATPTGTASVVVDRATNHMHVIGSYTGMTSTTAAAHLHGPAPAGSTAEVLFPLTVEGEFSGAISGSGFLNRDAAENLLLGLTYINVHTANNAPGEIRGQIDQPLAELPTIALEPVVENAFASPVDIVHARDGSGRLFIVDQRGKVFIIRNDQLEAQPFMDIETKLVPERQGFDERGLLSLAFAPGFAMAGSPGEGKVYVYYSAPSADAPGTDENPVDHQSVIAEFSLAEGDPDRVDPDSERILLTLNQPQFNHNGGQLAFGPTNGLLYISVGDGGSSNDNDAGHTGGNGDQPSGVLGNAQDKSNLLGKILRIDPFGTNGDGGQYGIPDDNPFIGQEGARQEIYAYGLRNPWRFSFDDGVGGTNELIAADVGQREVEEINLIESGGNYGWRPLEGTLPFDPLAPPVEGTPISPIAEYAHPEAPVGLPQIGTSITGGYVYRGSTVPELMGIYVFGDWTQSFSEPSGSLLGLVRSESGTQIGFFPIEGGTNPLEGFIPAFGEDENGEIYVATKRTLAPSATDQQGNPTGSIFRIVSVEVPPDPVTIELEPSKDNTIFSEGDRSNGSGQYLFTGRTAARNQGALRRALLGFDVAGSIPSGSKIQEVTLTLNMNKTIVGTEDVTVHRVLADWGEANSNASGQEGRGATARTGDATWSHRFVPDQTWQAEGGDFDTAVSATTAVNRNGSYDWSSAKLVADVQAWLDAPDEDFGWLLLTRETGRESAKRFDSREASNASRRPKLTVTFLPGSDQASHRDQWIAEHFDPGEEVDFLADIDRDTLNGVFEYGFGFDPKSSNLGDLGYSVDTDVESSKILISFRRDSRAVDLTYRVETSGNLVDWVTVVESAGGEDPSGVAFESEEPIEGEEAMRLVMAAVESDAPSQYVRISIEMMEN